MAFNPAQPREANGRWSGGGEGSPHVVGKAWAIAGTGATVGAAAGAAAGFALGGSPVGAMIGAKYGAEIGGVIGAAASGHRKEMQAVTISDSGQTAQLAHFGRIITLSRQALVNDDLSGFSDLPGKAAIRVADWENSVAWAHVTSNPVLGDGKALFHADHGNLAAAGAAISVASVGDGEAAMMGQTSLDGLKLNLRPAVLAVGPTKLTLARQFTTTITPHQMADVNPFAGTIDALGDTNISGAGWYLFAEPTALESFNFGYLQGAAGPQITPEPGFEVAGMRLRLSIDFYVQAVDHRGAYFNQGA